MPYRHAHWWILGLFPAIAVAFWPTYLGQIATAPFALHAHGATASLWLALLAAQSWTIHARRPDWHRAAGLATFAVVPLFAAAGPLALQGMARLYVERADPFHGTYGAQLAWSDVIAGPAVIVMVAYAFANRRKVRAHAAAMLSTALLVLPPVLARLLQRAPGFPRDGWLGVPSFDLSFHLGEATALAIAVWLGAKDRAARVAFGFAAAATAAQMIGFETIGRSAAWERLVGNLLLLPPAPMALAAAAGSAALLRWAWRRVPPRGGAAGTGAPATA